MDQPRRELRAFRGRRPEVRAAFPGESNAWESFWGWELLFGLAWAVALVFVLVDESASGGAKAATIGLMLVCAVFYVVVGRRSLMREEEDSVQALLYVLLVILAFIPATLIVPNATFGLFAICPQLFMLLSVRPAALATVTLNLAPAIRFFGEPLMTVGDLIRFGGTTVIAITFSVVFGPWITRIIRQSAERADLIRQLEASEAEVARLSIEKGVLAERERLAGEIHDTIAQGFTSIIMLIQAAQAGRDPARHLSLAVQTARENLAEARALVAALSPAPLDGSTLDDALRRLSTRLSEEIGVTVSHTVDGESRKLPPSSEVVLIRTTQEALANVRKHAAARSVKVSVEYGSAEVTLTVRDDGIGFDPATGAGFGLRGMRTRIEQQGGLLDVRSAPGEGASVHVTLPMGEK
ncbi:sensor histidine kinase [Herbidospora mongoliensis]|uniref:sensor histidine kinase n=1 Tax=Herbidospora mongoliensis TaxID=688067 RepID=UPI0009FD5CCC|nr:sensor histidine kinase [Herbidospora mongoliensis]